jgi:hypothetical protein
MARIPTRKGLAGTALMTIFATAGIVIFLEMLTRPDIRHAATLLIGQQ